jgi:hypothetical protein
MYFFDKLMSDLLQEIHRRICDPGAFLPRVSDRGLYYETIQSWSARAVAPLVEWLAKGHEVHIALGIDKHTVTCSRCHGKGEDLETPCADRIKAELNSRLIERTEAGLKRHQELQAEIVALRADAGGAYLAYAIEQTLIIANDRWSEWGIRGDMAFQKLTDAIEAYRLDNPQKYATGFLNEDRNSQQAPQPPDEAQTPSPPRPYPPLSGDAARDEFGA